MSLKDRIVILYTGPKTFADEKALLEKQKRIHGVTNTVFANNGTHSPKEKGDAVVEKVAVKDQEGNPIEYNDRIAAGATVTYTATLKAKEGKTLSAEELEKYKGKVKWLFWVGNTQVEATDEGEKGALRMRKLLGSSALEGENNKSFLNEEGKVTGDMLERCYLHYSVGSSEEGKRYTDTLTISWSKWLDEVERVRVEAYMEGGTPKKTSSGDATCSRIVQAQPEVIEAYWMNASGDKVRYSGYEQDLYLYINTLGLKGKTLEVQVHEKDFYETPALPIMFYVPNLRGNELIDWKNNSLEIERHDVIKQFKVGDRTRYENADKDMVEEEYKKTIDELIAEDIYTMLMCPEYKYTANLQLYVHFPKQEHLKPDKDNQYARITLTDKAQICNAYFGTVSQASVQGDVPATKDSASPTTKVTHYPKLEKGVLGQTVHLIAACANLNGKTVCFEVFEKTPLLEEGDKALTLLYKEEPQSRIKADVKDGFAVAEVRLQPGKEDTDNEVWEKELDPDQGALQTAELYIKVKTTENTSMIKSNGEFLKDKPFEFRAATLVYDIHSDGKMEKMECESPKKVRYIYHEASGKKHSIGKAKIHSTKRHIKKDVLSQNDDDDIFLVYAKDVQSYNSGNIKFKFLTWNSDSGRWYINPDCFAGLLGAMIEEDIEDLGFNGFSVKNGNSAGGSSSHINGEKGDLRYLSVNKDASAIHLFTDDETKIKNPNFDYDRQESFNKALYKFGWGRSTKMYSENFYVQEEKEFINPKTRKKEIEKVKVKKLLSHCTHKMRLGENGFRHYHHIHLTGFEHSIIKKR